MLFYAASVFFCAYYIPELRFYSGAKVVSFEVNVT